MVAGYATLQSAVQAMKDGAYDYVTKPFNLEELHLLLERVAGHLRLKTENRVLRESIKSRRGLGNIIGARPKWRSSPASSPRRAKAHSQC